MTPHLPAIPRDTHPPGALRRAVIVMGDLLLLAAALTLPLIIHTGLHEPYISMRMILIAAGASLLLPVWGAHCLLAPAPSVRGRSWPILCALFLTVMTASALLSDFRLLALRETGFFAACILFALWARERAGTSRLFERTAALLPVPVLLSAIYGFFQYNRLDFLDLAEKGKPVAFLGNANITAQFLVLALPVLVALAITGPRRLLNAAAFVAGLVQLMILQSRGGYLAFSAALIVFAYALWDLRRRQPEPRLVIFRPTSGKLLLLGAGLLLTIGTFLFLDQGGLASEVRSIFRLAPDSNRFRLLAWFSGMRMARDNPLLGVGPGHYAFYHPLYETAEFARLRGTFGIFRHLRAHSDPMNLLCETGILGLGVFVGLIAATARAFSGIWRSLNISWRQRLHAAGLAAAVAGLLVQSFVDFCLYNAVTGMLFWIYLGFLTGMAPAASSRISASDRVRKIAGVFLLAAGLVFLAMAPVRLSAAYRTEKHLRRADVAFENSHYERAAFFSRLALHLSPNNRDALALLADSLRNLPGKEKEALDAYRRWAVLEPNYLPILNRTGEVLYRLGDADAARKAFLDALKINPQSAPVLLNLGNLALGARNFQSAAEYFDRAERTEDSLALQNRPQYGIALAMLGRFDEALPRLRDGLVRMPDKAPLFLELIGDCHHALGREAEAVFAWSLAGLSGTRPGVREKIRATLRP